MIRLFIAATALGLSTICALAEPELKTTSVEFPQGSDMFPGGEKADAINGNCLACHSREMVLMQPALPKEEWAKEVAKMRKVYGAPVVEADVPAILDYLAALRPAK